MGKYIEVFVAFDVAKKKQVIDKNIELAADPAAGSSITSPASKKGK